jgi:hypothetical protein
MMNEKNPDPAKTSTKLSLAELLARSMDDEVEETQEERERWDDDEDSFGG